MRHYLTLLLLLLSTAAFSQLSFQPIRFDQALKKAGAEGKLVFLQFESATCQQCNLVADKAFSDTRLAQRLSQGFICVKIDTGHPDRQRIGSQYQLEKGFGSAFINPGGVLIHKYPMSTTFVAEYEKQIDLALQKAGESLLINKLEEEYKKGNRAVGLLEVLLEKRNLLGLATDSLLDEYTKLLPADSFASVRTIQFIAKMAPALDSRANAVFRDPSIPFSKAWYALPLNERQNINGKIISKTLDKAVLERNDNLANYVATFAQTTYTSNPSGGIRAYDFILLQYYDRTGDTTRFFPKALAYYQKYYMTVSVDSVKNMDSLNRLRLMKNAPAQADTLHPGTMKKTISYAPLGQNYTRELTRGAQRMYQQSRNPELLQTAAEWVSRGLEFYESPEALEVYARLLYRMKQTEKAISLQSRLIALQQERKYATKEAEAVLEKMKKGLGID